MRIDAQALPACCQSATVAEAAVVQEMQGATQKLSEAKKDKQAARTDKLHEMAEVTKKLRKIASETRVMGWTQLAVGIGGSLAQAAGSGILDSITGKATDKALASVQGSVADAANEGLTKAAREGAQKAVDQAVTNAVEQASQGALAQVGKYTNILGRVTSEAAGKDMLFSGKIKDLEAQRSIHDARQEKASGMEEIAQDAVTEAKRLADASLQRLEAMQRIQHEGQLAILRG
ncbi:MAG: hypothetical protein JRH20_26805 [Deltaproteobacteria bacterium]|nr:hypothetical protein [Deltaproteobacteria bacterium]